MSGVVLPQLDWKPSGGFGPRHGSGVVRVVIHRWGSRAPVSEMEEGKIYEGVVSYLRNPANRASAHVVYSGDIGKGMIIRTEASQLVKWSDYAWTQAAYNPTSVEVESADDIWVADKSGHYDELGFAQLARITAFLLATGGGLYPPELKLLPPHWSHDRGFCRHADLGAAGGGHTACPTTDLTRWRRFCGLVIKEYDRAGFRPTWGI